MTKLLQPLPAALFGLFLALVAGPGWYWFKSDSIVSRIVAAREAKAAAAAAAHDAQRSQGWDFWTIEMENLAGELKEQKAQLREEADALDQRKARLDSERQELDRIRSDLESMRHQIDERVIEIKADEMHNLRSLAQTYAKLDPANAVAILREMDDVTVVKILSLMKPDVTGPIFDTMATTPDGTGGTMAKRAAVLSEKLRLMKVPGSP
ncbi:MAG TPA: hypothetical protein VFE31_11550 [Opitutaceae bacterium]|jgi:flagellar motility protein MotE (MotC chaperone)|nr:hypothetical protein [Opitutaceae bacterium]